MIVLKHPNAAVAETYFLLLLPLVDLFVLIADPILLYSLLSSILLCYLLVVY